MLGENVGAKEAYNWSNITFSNSLEIAGRTLTGRHELQSNYCDHKMDVQYQSHPLR